MMARLGSEPRKPWGPLQRLLWAFLDWYEVRQGRRIANRGRWRRSRH